MSTLAAATKEELMQILTSNLIQLIPSNSDTPVNIHEQLLSISPILFAACKRDWEEGKKKQYKFKEYNNAEEEDEDCFVEVTKEMLVCFVRWAYIGDYTTEAVGVSSEDEPVVIEDEPAVFEDQPVVFEWGSTWGQPMESPMPSTKKGKRGKKGKTVVVHSLPRVEEPELVPSEEPPPPEPPIEEEVLESAPEPEDCPSPSADAEASKGKEPGSSSTTNHYLQMIPPSPLHPLYLHIQLYVFAHIYLISPLSTLALSKIKTHLQKAENAFYHFTNNKNKTTNEIFDVLEYAFSTLPESDELIEWLARYASWKLGDLREEWERLERLLRVDDGRFAVMLVRFVVPGQVNPFAS
ncbi:hypothetical protein G7Y89_g14977 [Cudoniella acicularis]|uniref:BTB domain-containing protein n=1 Tax=Cudoniella acicularis TaxID=354080 RepID=A0A8H4VQA4_9HELO|nr:hypothetical protein G7Y89_g14977 [Cudoniella acicularis]